MSYTVLIAIESRCSVLAYVAAVSYVGDGERGRNVFIILDPEMLLTFYQLSLLELQLQAYQEATGDCYP